MEYSKLVSKKTGEIADVRCSVEDPFPEILFDYFTEEQMSFEEYKKHKEGLYDMLLKITKHLFEDK